MAKVLPVHYMCGLWKGHVTDVGYDDGSKCLASSDWQLVTCQVCLKAREKTPDFDTTSCGRVYRCRWDGMAVPG